MPGRVRLLLLGKLRLEIDLFESVSSIFQSFRIRFVTSLHLGH
jgi:hypothetical protein